MAVLAAFAAAPSGDQTLAEHLQTAVFADAALRTVEPDPDDVAGFDAFLRRYVAALPVERAAVDHVNEEQPA